MGAQFVLDTVESADLTELARTSRMPVLATSLQATDSLYDQDLRLPQAWVFGNEGQGVSAQLLSLVSKYVIISQAKNTVESLNVASSATVCLFEQYRQRL